MTNWPKRIMEADRVAIDTETTGLRPYGGDVLRGISLAVEEGGRLIGTYIPVSHPDSPNVDPAPIIAALNATKARHEFHNGLFDFHFLAQHGYALPANYRDSLVLSWLFNENGGHTLKGLAASLLGHDAKAEQDALKKVMRGITKGDAYRLLRESGLSVEEARREAPTMSEQSKRTWATLTYDDIAAYAEKDAVLTHQLVSTYERALAADPLGKEVAVQREHDFQHTLYRMVRTGVRVDPDLAAAGIVDAKRRKDLLWNGFKDEYGCDLDKNAQVSMLVYGEWGMPVLHRTPGGAPSVARQALDEMAKAHPGVRGIVEYRQLTKAMGTYYEPLLHAIGEDGRVHSSFSSCRTVTGRLSSSDPNLMNIPRRDTLGGVRDCFVAEPGLELWEYDLDQAELRVAGALAGEPGLYQTILDGVSLHDETATRVFGPDFTGLQRRLAKNLNYGFPYGIGSRKFALYIVADTGEVVTDCGTYSCRTCTVCQASAMLDGFRGAYPNLVHTMRLLENYADKYGHIPLKSPGRYRHFTWPGCGGSRIPGYTALNAVVQGGVAEFMKDMMLNLDTVLQDVGRLVLQVHDSLVIECEPGTGPLITARLNDLSNQLNPFTVTGANFTMPLPFNGEPWSAHE